MGLLGVGGKATSVEVPKALDRRHLEQACWQCIAEARGQNSCSRSLRTTIGVLGVRVTGTLPKWLGKSVVHR